LKRPYLVLALAWAGFLLFLGSRPGDSLPKSPLLELPGADKVLHMLFYGVLGVLTARAAGPRTPRTSILLGALAGLLCGMIDERVQGSIPGRTPSWADLLADFAGAAIGGFLGRFRARGSSVTMPGSSPRGEGS
jgi:VanZ family protein